jgi:hypothetical protein
LKTEGKENNTDKGKNTKIQRYKKVCRLFGNGGKSGVFKE